MRLIFISTVTVFVAAGLLVVLVSRTVVPPMVEAEKRELVEILPLVRSAVELTLSRPEAEAGLKKIKDLSGFDITVINTAGVVSQTTLDGGKLRGSRLAVGERGATVFEVVSIAEVPSFIISTPLKLSGASEESDSDGEVVLAVSRPDKLIGKFYDELFTNVALVSFLCIVVSVPLGLYQRRRSRPARLNLAPLSEALAALAKKDFGYRMRANFKDDSFLRAQEAFNRYMEEMSREALRQEETAPEAMLSKTPEKPRETSMAEAERAFRAALGSIEEGIIIVEESGKIVAFNRKMEELTGLNADVVANHPLTDALKIVKESGEEATGIVPGILSTGVSEVFPENLMLRRRDGVFVPVAVKAVAIRKDLRGAVTHLVVVINAKATPGAKPVLAGKKPRSRFAPLDSKSSGFTSLDFKSNGARAGDEKSISSKLNKNPAPKDVNLTGLAEAAVDEEIQFRPTSVPAPILQAEKKAGKAPDLMIGAPAAAHQESEKLPAISPAKLPVAIMEEQTAAAGDAPRPVLLRYEEDTGEYGEPPPDLPV